MRQTRVGRPGRALAAVMLAIVVLVHHAGCSVLGDSPEQQDASDAIATEVQDALAQRPDLTTVKVVYQNNINVPATAYVTATVAAGTDFAPVVDEIVRRIWQSKLYPLSSIGVSVVDVDDVQRNTNVELAPDGKDKPDLERKYGPRPPR